MNNKIVSIIIPVYNASQYLSSCLESLTAQTYANCQFIIINDGSTDNSGEICDKFAESCPSAIVIHQENKGQNAALQTGLSYATGDYIAFTDSDDWLAPDAIEKLITAMTETSADLAVANAFKVSGTCVIRYNTFNVPAKKYEKLQISEEIYPTLLDPGSCSSVSMLPSRWAKLFKKDILVQIKWDWPDVIRRGEDWLIVDQYFLNCNSVVFIDDPVYYYRNNENSITHTYKENWVIERKTWFECMHTMLAKFDISSKTSLYHQLDRMYLKLVLADLNACARYFLPQNPKLLRRCLRELLEDDLFREKCDVSVFTQFPRKLLVFLLKHKCIRAVCVILHFYIKTKVKYEQ